MKLILIIVIVLTSLSGLSASEHAEVYGVQPLKYTRGKLIKFTDGTVGVLRDNNKSVFQITPGVTLEFIRTKKNEISVTKMIRKRVRSDIDITSDKTLDENLPQTIFPSYKKAQEELNSFNSAWVTDSQCYNRSHIWAYESYLRNIIFKKAFLFFSDDYIERYDFPWWFHNSPYALVQMREKVEERVMDKTFSPYPLKFKLWTDLFMKNKVECAVVDKYSEYSQRPGTFDCFIIKSTEYFWQPKDLAAFETSRIEKTKFIDWEVAHAYKQGFGVD